MLQSHTFAFAWLIDISLPSLLSFVNRRGTSKDFQSTKSIAKCFSVTCQINLQDQCVFLSRWKEEKVLFIQVSFLPFRFQCRIYKSQTQQYVHSRNPPPSQTVRPKEDKTAQRKRQRGEFLSKLQELRTSSSQHRYLIEPQRRIRSCSCSSSCQ